MGATAIQAMDTRGTMGTTPTKVTLRDSTQVRGPGTPLESVHAPSTSRFKGTLPGKATIVETLMAFWGRR